MKQHAGFSLLEMIGVLAVMAIFAGALAPSVFQMIEEGYQGAEEQSMASVSEALKDYVQYNKEVPSLRNNAWTEAVADYAGYAPARVLSNEKNHQRRLYIDPDFLSGTSERPGRGRRPYYEQDEGLDAAPSSPRILLVSSLDGPVRARIRNASQFDDVWDQAGGALIVESKRLLIERINLAPLFKRVVLSNASNNQVGYALEDGREYSVAAASGGGDGVRVIYVIAGTKLNLHADPYPGGGVFRQLIVDEDVSLRYELGGAGWNWVG